MTTLRSSDHGGFGASNPLRSAFDSAAERSFPARRTGLGVSHVSCGPSGHTVSGLLYASRPSADFNLQDQHLNSPRQQPDVIPSPTGQPNPNHQLQQHVVEQWMRRTEAHMQGLECLVQRMTLILEAVESRELGMN